MLLAERELEFAFDERGNVQRDDSMRKGRKRNSKNWMAGPVTLVSLQDTQGALDVVVHDARIGYSAAIRLMSNSLSFVRFCLLAVICFSMVPLKGAVAEGPIYNPGTGSMYYLLTQNTWTGSQAEALSLGGHLAAIQDSAEQNWIYRTFGIGFGAGRLLWIGLTDVNPEGRFSWTTQEPVNYVAWAPGEPNNSSANEDYVALYYHGHSAQSRWNDWPNIEADPIGIPFMGVVEVRSLFRNVRLVDFEGLPAMDFSPGPVPETAFLEDEFLLSEGVRFSSGGGPAAVVRLGGNHATSGVNGFAGIQNGQLNYSAPIEISLWTPQDPTLAATADFVSVRLDLLGTSAGTIRMSAFDLGGQLLAVTSINDVGGRVLSLAKPRMHRIVIEGNDSAAFDDLVIGNLTPSRPTLLSQRQGDMVRISWPAGFEDWKLQFTTSIEQPMNWLDENFTFVEFDGTEYNIRMPAERNNPYFYRLRKTGGE